MFPFYEKISTAGQMEELCCRIAEFVIAKNNKCFILLNGMLGSGKTTFSRGFGKALGIHENINSPTFNILNVYEGEKGILYHYDFYRISDARELIEEGFQEIWESDSDLPVIHAVEWWEKAKEIIPSSIPSYQISIDFMNSESEIRTVNGKQLY